MRMALLWASCLLVLAGCGSQDRFDAQDQGGIGVDTPPQTGCKQGETAKCSITLSQASGVLSCYHGTRTCVSDDQWGPCENGEVTTQVDPTTRTKSGGEVSKFGLPGRSTAALSTVQACINNPCNPECQYWAENPTDITNDVTVGGSPGPLPSWDTTTTTCAHAACAVNTPALAPSCHPCIKKVCDLPATAYCCTSASATAWDSKCVEAVYEQCSPSPIITPQICGFTILADGTANLANASTFPSSVGSNGTITMASGVTGKNLITKTDITIANAANFNTIYSYGTVNFDSGLTVGAVYGKTGIDLYNGVTAGSIFSGGNVTSTSTGWTVNGSYTAAGNCILNNASTINGDVNCGGNFALATDGTIQAGRTVYVNGNLTLSAGQTENMSAHVGGITTFNGWNTRITGSLYSGGLVSFTGGSNQVGGAIHGGAGIACPGGSNSVSGASFFRGTSSCGGNVTFPMGVTYSIPVGTTPPIAPTPATIPPFPDPPTQLPFVSDYARNTTALCAAAAAASDLTVPGSGSVSIAPGTRRNLYINNGGTLNFTTSGSYVFNNIDMASSTNMRFHGTGPWDITVCDSFNLRNSGFMKLGATATQVPGRLVTIYSAKTSGTCIRSESSTQLSGVLIAPYCGIDVGNGTSAEVLAWGKDISMGSGITYKPITQSECEAVDRTNGTGVGPTRVDTSGACPVTFPPVTILDFDPSNCESGLDCQVNRRCENVATDASCAHSKCVPGGPLDTAACRANDRCVDRICAVDSSCCSSSSFWAQSCVDKVATLCAAECGPLTKSACEHDACTVGLALSRTCSADVQYVCDSVNAACCDGTAPNSWDASCVAAYTQRVTGAPFSAGPAALGSLCDYAVQNGSGALNMDGTIVRGNILAAAGAINGYDQIFGNTYNNIGVYGNGHSGVQSGYSKVSISSVPYTAPTWADIDPTNCAGVPSGADSWAAASTKAPGSYGEVTITGNLTLPNGGGPGTTVNYYLWGLTLNSGRTLTLPSDGTKVNIFLCSSGLNVQSTARILSPTSDPLQLSLWVKSNNITFGDGSTSWGAYSIASGSGSLTLNGTAKVNGMIHNISGGLTGSWGSEVDASGVTRSACLQRNVDPKGKPNLCPTGLISWSASTVSGTPACTPNLVSGTLNQRDVADCSEADLALDEPCDNKVPVCNRGHTDLAANQAEIVFYPLQTLQFGTATPATYWQDPSVCNVGVSIPKGSCVTVTCPAFSGDMTAFLRMKAAASQTECTNLDNWTYYPTGRTCGSMSTATTKVVTEVYEAVCPANSAPIWGFLGWDTELQSGATINFEAALSSDGTTYGAFTALGTASASTSSEDCPFGSACAPDVGSKLFPGGEANHPRYLKLQMTLNPSGLNTATLAAWDISYTCRADQ